MTDLRSRITLPKCGEPVYLSIIFNTRAFGMYKYKTVLMLPQPHWMKISRLSENLSWKNLICARMLSPNAKSTWFKIYLSCVGSWHQREILVSMPMLIPLYDGEMVPFLTRRSRQGKVGRYLPPGAFNPPLICTDSRIHSPGWIPVTNVMILAGSAK